MATSLKNICFGFRWAQECFFFHKMYACFVSLSVCRQRLGDNNSINVQRIRINITAGQIKMHSNVRLLWLGWLERPQATGRAGGKGIEAVGQAHVRYPCLDFNIYNL